MRGIILWNMDRSSRQPTSGFPSTHAHLS